jgi:hypothetical protein
MLANQITMHYAKSCMWGKVDVIDDAVTGKPQNKEYFYENEKGTNLLRRFDIF